MKESTLSKSRISLGDQEHTLHEFRGNEGEYFRFGSLRFFQREYQRSTQSSLYTIVWNRSGVSSLMIDDIPLAVHTNYLTFCTPTNYLAIAEAGDGIMIQFNREFYCIQQHDHEVSCIGLLFYGSGGFPLVDATNHSEQFSAMLTLFEEELRIHDHIQSEMLHVILKRWIIVATRLFRAQSVAPDIAESSIDLVRQFHVLVEQHFRTKHSVADYADMLNKSPKTLSNLFAKYNQLTPRDIIHSRVIVEAKRLLLHTDRQIKDIGYNLGFDDVQNFSRFFKNIIGTAPLEYRQNNRT
jgi:AraC family transcriptional activator of pobA